MPKGEQQVRAGFISGSEKHLFGFWLCKHESSILFDLRAQTHSYITAGAATAALVGSWTVDFPPPKTYWLCITQPKNTPPKEQFQLG